MSHRRETPYKRTLPSGRTVWIARYTDHSGQRRYAKPSWNRGRSSFDLRREAQRAIDEAYDLPARRDTIAGYAVSWTRRHPRAANTNETNERRVRAVIDVAIEGKPLGEWCFDELRRRHANDLVAHMLDEQGRAVSGARGILGTLSAMTEDAITDEVASANPFKGMRIRADRARKDPREIRTWSFDQMREFAAAGRPEVRARTAKPSKARPRRIGQPGPVAKPRYYSATDYEAPILTLALTGFRVSEMLSLRRADYTGSELVLPMPDTATKRHKRVVPVPPSLAAAIDRMPTRIDSQMLFPAPSGGQWTYRNFLRDVWTAAKRATGMDPTPHEFRHSFVSLLRAAGIDDADLADVSGHGVQTMLATYTHPLRASHERIREVIG